LSLATCHRLGARACDDPTPRVPAGALVVTRFRRRSALRAEPAAPDALGIRLLKTSSRIASRPTRPRQAPWWTRDGPRWRRKRTARRLWVPDEGSALVVRNGAETQVRQHPARARQKSLPPPPLSRKIAETRLIDRGRPADVACRTRHAFLRNFTTGKPTATSSGPPNCAPRPRHKG
jgi:hypothetical protein